MRHNKIIGWERFLGVLEHVEKLSPWLSRQIVKHASEWPFWMLGAQIQEWHENQVWVRLAKSFRTSLDGEICQGHLVLSAELTLRLALLRFYQELPFRFRLRGGQIQIHNIVDQSVDIKFEIGQEERERLRLEMARNSHITSEFSVPIYLSDGRLAATVTFQVAFELEKFLSA